MHARVLLSLCSGDNEANQQMLESIVCQVPAPIPPLATLPLMMNEL